MRIHIQAVPLLLALTVGAGSPAAPANPQRKEYLSEAEADKIRDAGAAGPRIQQFTIFAEDRLRKIRYELDHIDPADTRRFERVNALLNGYIGCVDDAADLVELGVEKQEDIRNGVKEFAAKLKDFLPYLEQLAAGGPDREAYKDNLTDAIEATRDAARDAENAMKEMAPPPVRRRPA